MTPDGEWASMSKAEKLSACRILTAQGMTTRQMSEQLKTSRNAIIGMCRRNKIRLANAWGVRDARSARVKKKKPRPPSRPRFLAPSPEPEPIPLEPPTVEPKSNNISIFGLTNKTCRWPTGKNTGAAQLFCGHWPSPSRVYCPYHTAIATRPTQAWRPKVVR